MVSNQCYSNIDGYPPLLVLVYNIRKSIGYSPKYAVIKISSKIPFILIMELLAICIKFGVFLMIFCRFKLLIIPLLIKLMVVPRSTWLIVMDFFPICTWTICIPRAPYFKLKAFGWKFLNNWRVTWILGASHFFLSSFLIHKSLISLVCIDISLIAWIICIFIFTFFNSSKISKTYCIDILVFSSLSRNGVDWKWPFYYFSIRFKSW